MMVTKTRPRWDEFSLALFWTLAGLVLLYFGVIGYSSNLVILFGSDFSLPRFIISFGLVSLAVFGLVYSLRIFAQLPIRLPAWLDRLGPLLLGLLLLAGLGFSLFTVGVVTYALFSETHDRLLLAWGVVTLGALVVLATYQCLWALRLFEPFLPWPDEFYTQMGNPKTKFSGPMRLLLRLNSLQHALLNRAGKFGQRLENVTGPLLPEPDFKTTVVNEKADGRPGLEKSMIAHGGWHVNTLGFVANGTVIFALSDGGTVHYQAGGRKGVLFPPEIKLWEVYSDKVQTAALGLPYTFLTRQYQTPAPLQNHRFVCPVGGGKFALLTPRLIRVASWQNNQTQQLVPENDLMLRGFNGFVPFAFNPEGSKMAWCSPTGQTYYWSLEDNQVQSLRLYPAKDEATAGEAEGVWGLVFSPDGTKIATVGAQGVLLQNVYTGWRWFAPNDPTYERLSAFAFNYNGFEMAIGLNVHPDSLRKPAARRGRGANFNERTIAPAQPIDAAVSAEKWVSIVRLWDLRLPDYLDLTAGNEPLREIAFSPDNQMLAAVDEAGVLRVWDIAAEGLGGRTPRQFAQLEVGLSGRKTVLKFSPDMQHLVCATDNRLLLFSLARLRQEAVSSER